MMSERELKRDMRILKKRIRAMEARSPNETYELLRAQILLNTIKWILGDKFYAKAKM